MNQNVAVNVVMVCKFCLFDCRYQGPLLEEGTLDPVVSNGAASPEFTKLCAWIVSELRLYCTLEENVHATNCETRFIFILTDAKNTHRIAEK